MYIALPDNEEYLGPDCPRSMALQIYRSVGPSGPNIEYFLKLGKGSYGNGLIGVVHTIHKMGVIEHHLQELLKEILELERSQVIEYTWKDLLL
jgi:cation transport regulator ChaC